MSELTTNPNQRRGIPEEKRNRFVIQKGPTIMHICPVCGDGFPVLADGPEMEALTMTHLNDHTLGELLGALGRDMSVAREVMPEGTFTR